MATTTESLHRGPFDTGSDHYASSRQKSIPILPSSSASPHTSSTDPMDITPAPTATMGPPLISSPVAERQATNGNSEPTITLNGNSAPVVGAAAVAQQPKVVQTAFIHKLYNMLEDTTIQHLISWSNTNESFVMSPSTEFSKVLSSYFKHTNISSFVRQLNMYGFHKVSDVFHTGQPDAPLWEFRHGNGSFKRGDLTGLREIKRRASRHTLINRDSFSTASVPKPAAVPPISAPAEAMQPDPLEARLHAMEQNFHYFDARLARSEDTSSFLNSKCTYLSEGLVRCHQWNQELATCLLQMIPDQESQIYKDISVMRGEILIQAEMLRNFDDAPEPISSGSGGGRHQYFSNLQDNGHPISPRQMPVNDQRRPSQPSLTVESRPPFRGPHAPHLSISPRRYGSIGSGNSYSPSSARNPGHHPPPPPPPPMQHPLATVSSPPMNLSRRHTSADIRLHGWPGGQSGPNQSPYASGQNSSQWPSSPHRGPIDRIDEHREIRNSLAQYRLPGGDPSQHGSRQHTPPPPMGADLSNQREDLPQGQWALPGPKFNLGSFRTQDSSAPATRRSSMASNVHNLLNPAGAGEDDDQDPDGRNKRKRRLE